MMSARDRERQHAAKNRRELVAAGFTRRDLVRMGLVTGGGWLVPKNGLSARALRSDGAEYGQTSSPTTTPFSEELSVMPIKQPVSESLLTPAPTAAPNHAGGEGRTRSHQAYGTAHPTKYYTVEQREAFVSVSPQLDLQRIWGFDGITPGPTYVSRYGESIMVRNVNALPPKELNGGFGLPSVSTHLHNNHGPSESDGNPCDFFGPFEALDDARRGTYYDHHYPNVLAGIYSTHPGVGDINESLSTLWYHDHRVDFTSQNVYKGLAGFYLLFNDFDSGEETTGFRLPSFPAFDIPLLFADRVVDPISGQLFFDLFNLDGILGDKFLVNGHVQPKLTVSPRRYRFRLLDSGPSRFYQFHLTDPTSPSTVNRFYAIANDGNLLPKPVLVDNVRISVAERIDVIIDFTPFAGKSIYLENRLEQVNGRGPTGKVLAPGQGNNVLRFDVIGPPVPDSSADPATITKFYDLPNNTEAPRVTRTFRFERGNGMWQINGKFVDCKVGAPARFRIKQNTVERWILQNNSGGWQHPIHIHFEEFQMLKRNGAAPPAVERGRKDVARLQFNEQIELFFRFRDFVGRYPMHCHNVVHEDHAMMLLWEIDATGDTNTRP